MWDLSSRTSLDRAKFGFYRFQRFNCLLFVIVMSILFIKLNFKKLQLKISQW